MDMLNKICVKGARVYRTLNRPIVRSKVDAGFDLYPGEEADKPVISLKIKDFPEVRLLDLILVVCAVRTAAKAVRSVLDLFD